MPEPVCAGLATPVADIVIPATGAFWLAAAVLVALALGFLVWPLLRARAATAPRANRRAVMRALYRDRLAELEAETVAGQIDADTRAQVMEELGANLLEEYQAADPAPDGGAVEGPQPGSRAALWAAMLLVPLIALVVYLVVGQPGALDLAGASEVLTLDPGSERAQIEDWRTRLAHRVEVSPEDGQSWYLLGVSRLQLGEFGDAAEAFAKAHRYLGSDPNISLYWLQSRYLAAGGQLDDVSRSLAQQVLAVQPNHPLVLEMFAIDAFHRGDFRTAVEQLDRALGNPLPEPERASLMEGLKQARSHLGTLAPTIDVAVGAPAKAPRQGTLFVIARPPSGGMPYAVVRRPASTLPLSVRLDDTASMSGARLSNADSFQVVVRLSASGTPTPAPGDWEWSSAVLHPQDANEPLSLDATLVQRDAGAAAAQAAGDGGGDTSAVAIDVAVSAPPEAPKQGTVFVIARPPGGGMPYAVVRRPASMLPLSVRLDDSASMAGAKLSSAASVQVVVRLSLSGHAMPEPGDWEWRSEVLHPGDGSAPLSLDATLAPRSGDET